MRENVFFSFRIWFLMLNIMIPIASIFLKFTLRKIYKNYLYTFALTDLSVVEHVLSRQSAGVGRRIRKFVILGYTAGEASLGHLRLSQKVTKKNHSLWVLSFLSNTIMNRSGLNLSMNFNLYQSGHFTS